MEIQDHQGRCRTTTGGIQDHGDPGPPRAAQDHHSGIQDHYGNPGPLWGSRTTTGGCGTTTSGIQDHYGDPGQSRTAQEYHRGIQDCGPEAWTSLVFLFVHNATDSQNANTAIGISSF